MHKIIINSDNVKEGSVQSKRQLVFEQQQQPAVTVAGLVMSLHRI